MPDRFLSNIFLIKKNDRGNCSCIILKALNKFIPYKHFKTEDLHCLKYFQENNFLCKIDLKDASFSVTLHEFKKICEIHMVGNLYEFLCFCFGLGPTPKIS